jgi:hypothetical protein
MKALKQFVFNAILLEDTLDRLEESGISVRQNRTTAPVARIAETDFSPRIVHNAQKMASIYIAFFCLENAGRELISERLLERKGADWWNLCVPTKIRTAVEKLKEREESNRYHSQRSSELIGYTMFGNLGQIIIANWEEFSDLFPDQAWVTARFNDLEMSRNIIMHTGILPQLEIERIESIGRDWVRQVG